MIYIWFICMFVLVCVVNPESIKSETVESLWNGLWICIFILPIWYGIRQCANELVKIRKSIDKAGGGEK